MKRQYENISIMDKFNIRVSTFFFEIFSSELTQIHGLIDEIQNKIKNIRINELRTTRRTSSTKVSSKFGVYEI